MRRHIVLKRPIRTGIIAVAANDELLSNVGPAAWRESGALALEQSLPDEFLLIRPLVVHGGKRQQAVQILRDWCEAPNLKMRCDVIFTLGGDGMNERDVIPDATADVIERTLPQLADALHAVHRERSMPGGVSRAIAGYRGQTLIVNIPGSFVKPAEVIRLLLPLLPQALCSLGADAFEMGDPVHAGVK